jgi:predicted porin
VVKNKFMQAATDGPALPCAMQVRGAVLASAVFVLSAPAFAQDNVTIFGLASTAVESLEAKGASASGLNLPRTTRLSNYASFIGVRGTEDLGGGLGAYFHLEGDVGLDTGSGTGIASKYAQVGLRGGWGQVSFGRYDTPYLFVGLFLNPSFVGIGSQYSILGGGNRTGRANVSADRSSFERRQDNTVQYWTPVISGFQGKIMYGVGEEKTATNNPYMWSGSIDYNNGPVYIAYGRETLKNYAASGGSSDHADKIAASYAFASGTKLGAVYERIRWSGSITSDLAKGNPVGAARTSTRDAYFVYLQQRYGVHTFAAAYGADRGVKLDTGDIAATKAHQIVLHYEYGLSKRTSLFGVYTKLTNESASNNVLFGRLAGFASATGADPGGIALGIRHFF